MSDIVNNKEIVQSARNALAASKLPPREHFARLVRLGWIDAKGCVTKLLGGAAKPEPIPKSQTAGATVPDSFQA